LSLRLLRGTESRTDETILNPTGAA